MTDVIEGQGRPPRLVMLVDNGVLGDSRVIKSARSAQSAGYDVVVLGIASRPEQRVIGGVPVLLCPPIVDRPPLTPLQQVVRPLAYAHPVEGRRKRRESLKRFRRAMSQGATAPAPRALVLLLKALVSFALYVLTRVEVGIRFRATRYVDRRVKPGRLGARWHRLQTRRRADWRQLDPFPSRLSNGWQAELTRLRPDLIHAHDYRTLPAAATYKRGAGRSDVKVVYDAHEWVEGYEELGPARHAAAMQLEKELVHTADAVVTVSDDIARRLEEGFRLAQRPTVVLNAPEEPPGPTPGLTLRERCRLDASVPLMVYAGSVGGGRNLETCVRGLQHLTGAHLALVVGQPDSAVMKTLAELAVELGVRDRVHLTRYVDQEYVVDFVRGATVGLTPFRHNKNTENALPTKVREYLLAGVPQVVSDCRALQEFVTTNRIGEVYVADDVTSFVEAARRVLEAPDSYSRDVPAALLEANRWDSQGAALVDVYRGLLPDVITDGLTNVTAHTGAPLVDDLVLPHTDARLQRHLVVGPENLDGQAHAWAHAVVRTVPGTSAASLSVDPAGAGWPVDRHVTAEDRAGATWQGGLEREVAVMRSHVLLESARTLDGSSREPIAVGAQVARFERAGLVVGVVAHAPDVRDPVRHAERFEWSAFRDLDPAVLEADQARVATTLATLEWLGVPTYVTSLDSLEVVPWAAWLPVTVDVDALRAPDDVLTRAVPLVGYVPGEGSNRTATVLDTLASEGVIELTTLAATNWSAGDLGAVDVVVDALGLGGYGRLAVEAMAAGRVVLGQLGDGVRGRLTEAVPVVEVGVVTLDETLRAVVSDRETYRALAKQGPDFAGRHHDGTAAAEALRPFLMSGRGSTP